MISDFLGTTWWSVMCCGAGFVAGVWSCRTWLTRFFND